MKKILALLSLFLALPAFAQDPTINYVYVINAAQAAGTQALPTIPNANSVFYNLTAQTTCQWTFSSNTCVPIGSGGGGGATTPATSFPLKGNGSTNGVVAATTQIDYAQPFWTPNAAVKACVQSSQTGLCYRFVFGDSTFSEGVGNLGSVNNSLEDRWHQGLSAYGNAGIVYAVGNNQALGLSTRWTVSGTAATSTDAGPFQTSTDAFGSDFIAATSSTIYTLGGTGTGNKVWGYTFYLWAVEQTTTDICTVQMDASTTVSYTIPNTTPGSIDRVLLTSTAPGSHQFHVSAGASPCNFYALETLNNTTGVVDVFSAHGSARSDAFGGTTATQIAPLMAAVSPSPVMAIVGFGINNMIQASTPTPTVTSFTSDMNNIMAAVLTANPLASIEIIDQHNIGTAPVNPITKTQIQTVEQAIWQANPSNIGYYSLATALGSFAKANTLGLMNADGLHCTDLGCETEADDSMQATGGEPLQHAKINVGAYVASSMADYMNFGGEANINSNALSTGFYGRWNGTTTMEGMHETTDSVTSKSGWFSFSSNVQACGGGQTYVPASGLAITPANMTTQYVCDANGLHMRLPSAIPSAGFTVTATGTGCTAPTGITGGYVGSFVAAGTGSCVFTLTSTITAGHGYHGGMNDVTNPVVCLEGVGSTTTDTFSCAVTTADVIKYDITAY